MRSALEVVRVAPENAANNLQRLHALGQSAWLDYVSRGLLESGELARMVESGWIRGVTSNPTIFLKAITSANDYGAALDALRGEGVTDPYEAFLVLASEDLRAAADALREVYESAAGRDGFISFEAQEGSAAAMVAEARRVFGLLDRPNVMIKVPGTAQGIEALPTLIAEGINVNITLLFAIEVYEKVALAYIDGLERRRQRGLGIERVASVASFFVSRVDTKADVLLPEASPLRGRVAVANARLAYQRFQEIFSGPRWQALAAAGAQLQRPLWASTGTKNAAYSDTLYVDDLVAANTVNTMPAATLLAFLDHGRPELSIEAGIADAAEVRRQAAAAGVDLDVLGRELLAEGLTSFGNDFAQLLGQIEKKLTATPRSVS